jgi:hypothetical protein
MSQDQRIVAVLVLMTVAIVGYLDGHGRASTTTVERTREASNAVTVVNYNSASGWGPASAAPAIPGLSVAQPLILGPGGQAAQAGLIVGRLLDSEFGPVPPQFLTALKAPADTEVVDLLNTQAYRYSGLVLARSGLALTLYTIPTSATSTTAIVCYARAGFSDYLQACERLVATLTIAGASPQVEVRTYQSLSPQLAYGRQVSAIAARVHALLGSLRPQLREGASRTTAITAATRLAGGLAGAAASLGALHPPPAAARAQGSLAESLARAHEGYAALQAALSDENSGQYAAALSQIYAAEASLSGSLRDFSLLAYK